MIGPTPATGYPGPLCPLCDGTGWVGITRCRFCQAPPSTTGPSRAHRVVLTCYAALALFTFVVEGWHITGIWQLLAVGYGSGLLAFAAAWGRQ